MRSQNESNAINRVLKARGLPQLDESGATQALARLVEDHKHFEELLRACEPTLRREMYEAMRPHLRFPAAPLDFYVSAAGEHAAAAELPVMDELGNLHPYMTPSITTVEVQVPPFQLWVKCSRCDKVTVVLGTTKADAVYTLRVTGWAYDESLGRHLCADCLDGTDAVD